MSVKLEDSIDSCIDDGDVGVHDECGDRGTALPRLLLCALPHVCRLHTCLFFNTSHIPCIMACNFNTLLTSMDH